jgi:hypothetical protein
VWYSSFVGSIEILDQREERRGAVVCLDLPHSDLTQLILKQIRRATPSLLTASSIVGTEGDAKEIRKDTAAFSISLLGWNQLLGMTSAPLPNSLIINVLFNLSKRHIVRRRMPSAVDFHPDL